MTPEDFFSEPLEPIEPYVFPPVPKHNINYRYLKDYLLYLQNVIEIKRKLYEKGDSHYVDIVNCPEIVIQVLKEANEDKEFIKNVKLWYEQPEYTLGDSVGITLENYLPYSTLEDQNVFYENYYIRIPKTFEEDYFKWSRNRKLKRIMKNNAM